MWLVGSLMGVEGPGALVNFTAERVDRQAFAAAMRRLGMGEQRIVTDAVEQQFVTVILANADQTAVRQATAHALDRWWSDDGAGNTGYDRLDQRPSGPLVTRTYTSGLMDDSHWEQRVTLILKPWLTAAGAGIAMDPRSGMWVATLDSDGHRHLVALLGVLERREAICPDVIATPGAHVPTTRLDAAISANTWTDLAVRCATALHVSISLSPVMPPSLGAIDLAPGDIAALTEQLARRGLQARWIDGVWCWGAQRPERREHPLQRLRYAFLDTHQIIPSDTHAGLVIATIRRHVDPTRWAQPGSAIEWYPDRGGLLLAGDPATLHRVWDVLDQIERIGLDAALRSLSIGH
jgi:hypothetical protein